MWYSHVPGSFEPLALEQGGRAYFYHLDGLGTPLALTDAEGRQAVRYDYAAFGARRRHGGRVRQALVFPGQYLDEETGLHYNWHRYYDPSTGRYLSPDPIGLAGGLNLYGYVGNNPINYVDPTGQFLVSGTVLVGYVYGPAIVAAGTAAAYRLGPYLPAIGEFLEGFVMPGPPPPSPAGYAGSATRYAIDEAIDRVSDWIQDAPVDNCSK
ncbi:RHS repeat-associated core domain-containing protein [Dissulfurirhabdus thermomarina]|uniref:RHS repeat-associated core domain-containing protein n=1 Tax=Dissulfurirhabdus thermomarina TaxID=1765737 RepID=UPI00215D5816|nr:RHS repeat-associated core domain-containing protein [Dissulfurirhabdus thermomarina]